MKRCLACVLTLLQLLVTSAASAQDGGSFSLSFGFPRADQDFTRDRAYRAYVETRELAFQVTATNESDLPVRVDQRLLRNAVTIGMSGADEIPVNVQWSNEAHLDGAPRPTLVDSDKILELGPHTFVTWPVRLTRADGLPFSSGTYRVNIRIARLSRALTTPGGALWSGRVFDVPLWTVALEVRPPTTAREQARLHTLIARDAAKQGEYVRALDEFSRAATADPTYTVATVGIADMHLNLGRYREAIPIYESVLATREGEKGLSRLLAEAYLGIGDTDAAVRVLRRSGYSDVAIDEELEKLRNSDALRLQRLVR